LLIVGSLSSFGFSKKRFLFGVIAPFSNVRIESRATDPSFDQEDAEDPEYTALNNDCFNDNEGVMSLPTI
jgi:hypothetical protein